MITAWEVKRFSPAGRDYPEVNICEAIPHIEEAFGYACLGEELYEYLLSKIAAAGVNGQFRTPRHIIDLMVQMTAPGPADAEVRP